MIKSKIKKAIIFAVIILIVLIVTNPSPDSFRKSLPLLTNLPNMMFSNTKYSQYSVYGRRNNFLVCSIYDFEFNAPENSDFIKKLTVLGIAGNFFVISESRI